MAQRSFSVTFWYILILGFHGVLGTFSFTEDSVSILLNRDVTIGFVITNPLDLIEYRNVTVNFLVEHERTITLHPESVYITDDIFEQGYVPLTISGISPGKSDIRTKITPDRLSSDPDAFTVVNVHRNDVIVVISEIIGWIYFLAWSFSFYPQVWTNFSRKSVVGLSFDFVSLNIVGYACYSVFNIGLYAIPEVREQYSNRYPQSVIPVLTNDIIFAIHGSCITIVTGIQCLIYESSNQTVSTIVKCQHAAIGAIVIIAVGLVNLDYILWLDFIYTCSYIKLFLTLTKYIPQAYMNYRRKSTVGWNIYNVVADVTGGLFSITQMFLNAYNFDEWESLHENPTKFLLGVVSILFDVVFITQHYVLYREHTASELVSMLEEEKIFIEKIKK